MKVFIVFAVVTSLYIVKANPVQCKPGQKACGDKCYNTLTEACCSNKDAHRIYSLTTQHCNRHHAVACNPGYISCGTHCYKPSERVHGCCDGKALYVLDLYVCHYKAVIRQCAKFQKHRCGQKCYSQKTHICCGGEIKDKNCYYCHFRKAIMLEKCKSYE